MGNIENSKNRYEELFLDEKSKAQAFDKIAEKYYFCNFGSTSKSDLDVLMFSIYLEEILKTDEEHMNQYSDYTLSKYLGITQSKVSSLKVKKQLLYPYKDFDWKRSFERVCENARYDNGKIKIFIPDKNLYLELKNAVEENGGFVEAQLNPTLLQLTPEHFINLVVSISDDKDRDAYKKKLRKELREKNKDTDYLDSELLSDTIKNSVLEFGTDFVLDVISGCVPAGNVIKNIVNSVRGKIKKARR